MPNNSNSLNGSSGEARPPFAFDLAAERKKSALLPDGKYRAVITQAYCKLDDKGHAEYVILTFDITDGEYKGIFDGIDSGDGEPDTARNRGVRLTIAESSKKGRAHAARAIETIMECNPGFDPSDALLEGGWGVFVGKKVVVKVEHHVYHGVAYNDFSFINWTELHKI